MQRTRNPSNRVKRRRGSNPLDSFYKWIFLPYLKNIIEYPVTNMLTPFPPDCIRLHQEVFLFKKIFVDEKNYHFLQGSSYKYNKIESFI